VPLKVYDETLRVLKSAVQKAKLGREEELQALQRLDEQASQARTEGEGTVGGRLHRGGAAPVPRLWRA
jgi:hypothetical protein